MGGDGYDASEPGDLDSELGQFLAQFGPEVGEEMLEFAAMLFIKRWLLGQRLPWPTAFDGAFAAWLLLGMAAARCDAGPHLTPGGSDLTRIPSAPLAHARATLTAAPPARVPCQAGTTG
jgi:hypothetical protein